MILFFHCHIIFWAWFFYLSHQVLLIGIINWFYFDVSHCWIILKHDFSSWIHHSHLYLYCLFCYFFFFFIISTCLVSTRTYKMGCGARFKLKSKKLDPNQILVLCVTWAEMDHSNHPINAQVRLSQSVILCGEQIAAHW